MTIRERVFVAAVCVISASASRAQEVDAKLQEMEKQMAAVEAGIGRLEQAKTIDFEENLEGAMQQHVEATKAAFAAVMDDLKKYQSTNQKPGTLKSARDFEKKVHDHQRRAEEAVHKLVAIELDIRTGAKQYAKPMLQKLNPGELREFRKMLLPETDHAYKKAYPELFVGDVEHTSNDEYLRSRPGLQSSLDRKATTLLRQVLEGVVSPAEAASVVICVVLCPGTACLSCVAAASVAGGFAVYTLGRCLDGCGTCAWWRPQGCWCKAGCWTGFLLFVA